MEEPVGVPGHGSKEGPAKMLQEELRRLGISYEAEGETTRIHIHGAIVEAKDDPDRGYIVQVQTPLPTPGEDPGSMVEAYRVLATVVSGSSRDPEYGVEEPVPGYPSLVTVMAYGGDLDGLVRELLSALRSLARA